MTYEEDLIERYLYAATRHLPRKQREDVSQELRSLVEDLLLERCQGRKPAEKDVRIVLTELGTPEEVYDRYDDSTCKCLIGQPYYHTYRTVLKIVLACVALGMVVSALVMQMTQPQSWYLALGKMLTMVVQADLMAFAILTILFAVFYRKGIRISDPFSFDDLPPVPQKKERSVLREAVVGIVLNVAFLVIFLEFPQIIGGYAAETKSWIPVFSVQWLRSHWYILCLIALLGIAREAVVLHQRQYNKTVMWVTVADNLLCAGLHIWWLTRDVLNPAFVERFGNPGGQNLPSMSLLFLIVVLFALVLDTAEIVYETLK